jgi:hypothetical protein
MPRWHTWICDYNPAEYEQVPKGYISRHYVEVLYDERRAKESQQRLTIASDASLTRQDFLAGAAGYHFVVKMSVTRVDSISNPRRPVIV